MQVIVWLRQAETERCAAPGRALHMNIPAMCLNDAARDGKPKPGPACGAASRFFAAIKPIEDMREVFRANALAGIVHVHFHNRACSPRMNIYISAALGVAERVADKIVQHTPDSLCIHKNRIYIFIHTAA